MDADKFRKSISNNGSKWKEKFENRVRPKPIFPIIDYERKWDGVELSTYVRIERDGKYYTLLFRQSAAFGPDMLSEIEVAKCYQRLIEHIHVAMYHHKFPDFQNPDTDQTPEKERLEKIYPFFSIKDQPKL